VALRACHMWTTLWIAVPLKRKDPGPEAGRGHRNGKGIFVQTLLPFPSKVFEAGVRAGLLARGAHMEQAFPGGTQWLASFSPLTVAGQLPCRTEFPFHSASRRNTGTRIEKEHQLRAAIYTALLRLSSRRAGDGSGARRPRTPPCDQNGRSLSSFPPAAGSSAAAEGCEPPSAGRPSSMIMLSATISVMYFFVPVFLSS